MHLVFFIRGIKQQTDIFLTIAQGQFWKWKRKNLKTGNEEQIVVQGALRPTILGAYEYVFPEECLSEVLAMFGIHRCDLSKSFKTKVLTKIFQCEKIPEKNYEEAEKIVKENKDSAILNNSWRAISHCQVPGVHIIEIGIKRDRRGEWPEIGYEQEML